MLREPLLFCMQEPGLVGHETAVGLHGDLCLALLQFQGTDGDAGDGALLVDLVTELTGDIEVIEVEGQCEGLLQGIQECGLEGFDWFAMLRGWSMARE